MHFSFDGFFDSSFFVCSRDGFIIIDNVPYTLQAIVIKLFMSAKHKEKLVSDLLGRFNVRGVIEMMVKWSDDDGIDAAVSRLFNDILKFLLATRSGVRVKCRLFGEISNQKTSNNKIEIESHSRRNISRAKWNPHQNNVDIFRACVRLYDCVVIYGLLCVLSLSLASEAAMLRNMECEIQQSLR